MASVAFIIVSFVIVIVALTVVNIANRRETRSRLIAMRISQLKRKIQDMEELCVSLEPLLESSMIPSIINEEIIDSINGVSHFGDETRVLDIYRENAETRRELLTDSANKAEIYRAQDSDAKMARALYQLNEAGQLLRSRQAKGLLAPTDMQNHLAELSWAHMMVKVATHVIEGQKSYENNNLAKALAFCKKAQQIVMETGISDERRPQLIRDIGRLLDNTFKEFSSELIPEYQTSGEYKDLASIQDDVKALNP